ncbi:MAG: hypothetical protein Q8904_14660 [Bacteroidota bacterium]|nr:hypothetical protein [Bacteroidota bacterium]
MKTKLFLLFLLPAFICNAQGPLKFMTFNLTDVREFSDSIARNAREGFQFAREGVSEDNRMYYEVVYTNHEDEESPLVVLFRIDYVGGNGDRINPGTPQYLFNKATGRFIDLFPFWLRFMKPEAVKAVILDKKKDEAIVRGATYDFTEGPAGWSIEKF